MPDWAQHSVSDFVSGSVSGAPRELLNVCNLQPAFHTPLGALVVGDCLPIVRSIADDSVDLIITSPPYSEEPRRGSGAPYDRGWYRGYFLQLTAELIKKLKPHGSFVLSYRSRRDSDHRGTLQGELVFWLRDQGYLVCEEFIWGRASTPGRSNRFRDDAIEYCSQFAKSPHWQFFPGQCLTPTRAGIRRRGRNTGPTKADPASVGSTPARKQAHFTLSLPSFFIRLLTRPGEIVFDPFGGTGTTAVAAEKLGRRWLLIEGNPRHASVLTARMRRRR
jgi:site-specific DNA-methyltransferase (adenine-specific)